MQKEKEFKMVMEQNPLNGCWMCWIPDTISMYAIDNKRDAVRFVKNVNDGILSGKIYIEDGQIKKKSL